MSQSKRCQKCGINAAMTVKRKDHVLYLTLCFECAFENFLDEKEENEEI